MYCNCQYWLRNRDLREREATSGGGLLSPQSGYHYHKWWLDLHNPIFHSFRCMQAWRWGTFLHIGVLINVEWFWLRAVLMFLGTHYQRCLLASLAMRKSKFSSSFEILTTRLLYFSLISFIVSADWNQWWQCGLKQVHGKVLGAACNTQRKLMTNLYFGILYVMDPFLSVHIVCFKQNCRDLTLPWY